MSFSDYQMLCASSMAYEINNGNFTPPTSGSKRSQYNALGQIVGTKVVQYSEAACLLFNTDQGIIVAFRGTIATGWDCSTLDDWLTNFQFNFTLWDGGVEVHSGFASDVRASLSSIENTINEWGRTKKIYVTGHSQGGGVAVLTSYKLKEKSYDIDKVTVFAAPSAGGKTFAERYNNDLNLESKTIRYQHAGDVIPMLPPDMASVPVTKGETIQNLIQVILEAITKANAPKRLESGNSLQSCTAFGLRVLEVFMKIYQSVESGHAGKDIKDVISYYSVGKIRFIEFNNKIESNISYYSQVINLIPAIFDEKGGGVGNCHSLDKGYEPALKK